MALGDGFVRDHLSTTGAPHHRHLAEPERAEQRGHIIGVAFAV